MLIRMNERMTDRGKDNTDFYKWRPFQYYG